MILEKILILGRYDQIPVLVPGDISLGIIGVQFFQQHHMLSFRHKGIVIKCPVYNGIGSGAHIFRYGIFTVFARKNISDGKKNSLIHSNLLFDSYQYKARQPLRFRGFDRNICRLVFLPE